MPPNLAFLECKNDQEEKQNCQIVLFNNKKRLVCFVRRLSLIHIIIRPRKCSDEPPKFPLLKSAGISHKQSLYVLVFFWYRGKMQKKYRKKHRKKLQN